MQCPRVYKALQAFFEADYCFRAARRKSSTTFLSWLTRVPGFCLTGA